MNRKMHDLQKKWATWNKYVNNKTSCNNEPIARRKEPTTSTDISAKLLVRAAKGKCLLRLWAPKWGCWHPIHATCVACSANSWCMLAMCSLSSLKCACMPCMPFPSSNSTLHIQLTRTTEPNFTPWVPYCNITGCKRQVIISDSNHEFRHAAERAIMLVCNIEMPAWGEEPKGTTWKDK